MNDEEKNNDAIKIAPHLHKVIFENEKIRVLKVTVKPGEKAEMHWHPENMNYILESGTLRFTKLDGSKLEVKLIKDNITSSKSGSHGVENIGDSEVRTIQVEIKEN